MPRVCTVCQHPDRKAIDKALLSGEAPPSLASRYFTVNGAKLGRMALQRHKDAHLPQAMTKAKDAAEIANGDDLLAQAKELQRRALSILDKAEEENQLGIALSAIRETRGVLELLAKMMGQINDAPVVNITINPQWLSLRAVIVQTLAPFPDARLAVADALARLEAGADARQ